VESRPGKRRIIRPERSNRRPTLKRKNQTAWACTSQDLGGLIRRRAENLFETQQLLCSEAVLYVINRGLKGGLPAEMAIRLASAFPEGVGGAGCICGAFSGAVMALGLFLGRQELNGRGARKVQARGRELYELFRSKFGTTCCRVLTKGVRDDPKALFKQCAGHTGEAAALAAQIILAARPEVLEDADWDFLASEDSKLAAGLSTLLKLVRP
jgi:C_GCAxxG_C_C family probable redox protein